MSRILRKAVGCTVAVLAILICNQRVQAQRATASVSGTVTDASKAPIPGARINVRNLDTGVERDAVLNEVGFYSVTGLPVGRYSITVSSEGFSTYGVPELVLQVDQQATLNAELQVGSLTETISVVGTVSSVDTRSSTVSTVINQQMVADLPLNGRNVLQLMRVTPGTLLAGTAGTQSATRPEAVSELVSASGGGGDTTTYVMDGGIHEDPYTTMANVLPNPDAVQEFSFQTNNYGAKFAGRGGGVVNVVTKSGTNEFHGSAFEYLRNSSLNARNFFAPGADGLKRNQYGFSFGGPIRRNQTFFFVSWQGTQVRVVPNTLTAVVPTGPQRSGDFSSTSTQLRDPRTGAPIPGNKIPSSELDPVAQNILTKIPVAASNDGLIRYQRREKTSDNQYLGRVDHNVGTRQRISGRYFFDELDNPTIADPNNILSGIPSRVWKSRSAVFNYTNTVSPTVLTNTTLSYNRVFTLRTPPDIPGFIDFGVQAPNLSGGKAMALSVSNYFNQTFTNIYRVPRNQYNIQHSWTMVRGGHEMDWGADMLREQSLLDQDFQSDGNFVFGGQFSGNNLVDFMYGKPSTFSQITPLYTNAVRNLYGLYFQDNYKVSRRLTLNLGVRWNPMVPFVDAPYYQTGVFDDAAYQAGVRSTRYPTLPPGYLVGNDPGVPKAGRKAVWGLLDPRVGFALDVFGNGRTSIRAGYGRFHYQDDGNTYNSPIQNAPNVVRVDFVAPHSLTDPYRGQQNPFANTVLRPVPPSTVFPLPLQVTAYQPDITAPDTHQWNLTIEQGIFSSMVGRIAYQGSAGRNLTEGATLNAAVFGPGANRTNTNQRRPRPEFQAISIRTSEGKSNYHALVASAEQRVARGLAFLVGFSWQKALTSNAGTFPYGQTDPNYGPTDYDRRTRLTASFNYELPSPASGGALEFLFGGWQANGIISSQSGGPLNIATGVDNSLTGIGGDRVDIVGDPKLPDDRPKGEQILRWFNPDAFQQNATGTFGTLGRNTERGPGLATVDFSAFKIFPLPFEGHRMEFRAEFFNLLNHANLGDPNTTRTSNQFGRITTANEPRIIQFALRYTF